LFAVSKTELSIKRLDPLVDIKAFKPFKGISQFVLFIFTFQKGNIKPIAIEVDCVGKRP
jgi:hypothetical protein